MPSQYPYKLTVVLEPEEDGGYSVHCPRVPHGRTPSQASLGGEKARIIIGMLYYSLGYRRHPRGLTTPGATARHSGNPLS